MERMPSTTMITTPGGMILNLSPRPKQRESKAEDQELELLAEPEPLAAPPMSKKQRQPDAASKRKATDVHLDD
jgi:hypothetical protein